MLRFHSSLFFFLCHRVKINSNISCTLFWPFLIFVTTTFRLDVFKVYDFLLYLRISVWNPWCTCWYFCIPYVYPLVTKHWVVWNYFLLNSLLIPFGCKFFNFKIQKYSLIFNSFWRVDLSGFVWFSYSVSINFVFILKLHPPVSKWFDAGIRSFLVTFFLWLLSLILNSVSDFPSYCFWNFKHFNKNMR